MRKTKKMAIRNITLPPNQQILITRQQPNKNNKKGKWPFIIVILFTTLLVINIYLPPLGTKTSTDFGRIMDLFELYYQPNEMDWNNFHSTFNFNRLAYNGPSYNGYMATTSIFILISMIPNYIARIFISDSNGLYYIICLGIVYAIGYIFSFYTLMALIRQKLSNKLWLFILVSSFGIWAFSDILFTEYFNSFFQEPAFIVTIFLFIVCFLRFNSFLLDIILLTLVLFSKEQNLIFALLIIPVFIKHKININKLIITITLFASVIYIYGNINTYSLHMNSEDGLLSGLLHKTSANQAKQMLAKLGLDPEMYVLRDHDFWGNVEQLRDHPQDVNLQQQFKNAQQITKTNTLLGYLLFPGKFFSNYLEYVEINSKSPFVNNYSYDSNGALVANYASYFAKLILPWVNVLLVLNLLIVIVIPLIYKSSILRPELALFWVLNLNLLLVIPVNFMGAGYAEPVRHCLELLFTETINLFLLVLIIKPINAYNNLIENTTKLNNSNLRKRIRNNVTKY